MTRELDAEIATLDGCTPKTMQPSMDGHHQLACGCRPKIPGRHSYRWSSDLNALMTLIRRRWPGAEVRLWPAAAGIYPSLAKTFETHSQPEWTDAERLANAVLEALRAEQKK